MSSADGGDGGQGQGTSLGNGKRKRSMKLGTNVSGEVRQFQSGMQKLKTHNLEWHVNQFELVRSTKRTIESQVFECRLQDELYVTKWRFAMVTSSGGTENQDDRLKYVHWVGVTLTLVEISPVSSEPAATSSTVTTKDQALWTKVTAEVKMVNQPGGLERRSVIITKATREDEAVILKPKQTIKCSRFFRRDSPDFVINEDGSVTIFLEVVNFILLASSEMKGKKAKTTTLQRLSNETSPNPLACLEGDQETSDMTLVSSDEKKFHAHRLILSKRSPVFQAMLRTDMEERRSGIIRCDDLSGKCIKILLHFMYTGNLASEWAESDVITEMTYAAEKYQLQDLIELLDELLGSVCRVEDAPKMLKWASQISLKTAEGELLDLVKEEFSKVEDTNSLNTLCMKVIGQLE